MDSWIRYGFLDSIVDSCIRTRIPWIPRESVRDSSSVGPLGFNSKQVGFSCKAPNSESQITKELTLQCATRRGFCEICSFVRSFCPSSCRDRRSLLKLGKGINRLSMTMACNVTRAWILLKCFRLELWLAHLDGRL